MGFSATVLDYFATQKSLFLCDCQTGCQLESSGFDVFLCYYCFVLKFSFCAFIFRFDLIIFHHPYLRVLLIVEDLILFHSFVCIIFNIVSGIFNDLSWN